MYSLPFSLPSFTTNAKKLFIFIGASCTSLRSPILMSREDIVDLIICIETIYGRSLNHNMLNDINEGILLSDEENDTDSVSI
jgi:hypothetical protein